MRRILNRRNVLIAIATIVVLPVLGYEIWSASASARGKWAAQIDLAHGYYRVLGYGLPPAGVDEYKDLLAKRYGVEYRQVALCIVSEPLVSYVEAYDEVSGAAIKHKFGSDVFKKTWDEATKMWQQKHQAELQ
jgi:hypothetical protein